MSNSTDFERRQLSTFATVWAAYAAYYLCRMNLSGAQATIASEYGLSKDCIGIVVATFSAVYGFGQLINGPLCDRFGARRTLATGLIGSGLVSIAFSFSGTLWVMGVLWTMNGVFQSMGFVACVRTLANWFSVHHRGRMSGWFSLSYKIGHIAALALTGWLVGYSWRWAFRVPGAALVLVGGWVLFNLHEAPRGSGTEVDSRCQATPVALSTAVRWIFSSAPLWISALSCLLLALTSYGYLYWLPHYWSDMGASPLLADVRAACYPLGGCVGALAIGWFSDHIACGRRPPVIAIALLTGSLLVAVTPLVPDSMLWLRVLCAAGTGALLMGGHAHLAISIPMDVASQGPVGTAAGFINALNYVGATLTGFGSGWVAKHWGWETVFVGWACAAGLSGMLIAVLWNHPPASGGAS